MKLKDLCEGRTKRSKTKTLAPRTKELHALKSKKGGGHFSKKSDFKRAKEKEKFHKEMFSRWDGQ